MSVPTSNLPLDDQLLLTLMRLRLGLLYKDLAWRFNTSPSSACRCFNNILKCLHEIMKGCVVWLPRSRIQRSMPQSFIDSGHGNTTCIFDCTEVALQRPSKQKARAQTYSSYKAHNTVKFLTVIAPNGLIMFVSRTFGGRASDKYIVKNCGVQEFFVKGDVIMADRGFSLDPYLEAQGVKMNVPAFTKGMSNLECKTKIDINFDLFIPRQKPALRKRSDSYTTHCFSANPRRKSHQQAEDLQDISGSSSNQMQEDNRLHDFCMCWALQPEKATHRKVRNARKLQQIDCLLHNSFS